MKLKALAPVLAFAAVSAACEDKEDPTNVNTSTANVRFVNAIQGTSGNVLLTANGSAVGSAQTFGGTSTTCSRVTAGTNRTLAFGTAGSGGNSISSQLGTMNTNLDANGSYTLIATGSTASPRLLVLNNTPTTTATSGNANIRFVNATGQAVDFFSTSGATLGTATFANVGANTVANSTTNAGFTTVPTTNTNLTFRSAGGTTNLFTTTGTFQSGQNYTVVLLPTSTGTGFQTLTLQGC